MVCLIIRIGESVNPGYRPTTRKKTSPSSRAMTALVLLVGSADVLPEGVVRQRECFLDLERSLPAAPAQQNTRRLQADGEIDGRRRHKNAARFGAAQREDFRRGQGAIGEAEAAEINRVSKDTRGVAFVEQQEVGAGVGVGIDGVAAVDGGAAGADGVAVEVVSDGAGDEVGRKRDPVPRVGGDDARGRIADGKNAECAIRAHIEVGVVYIARAGVEEGKPVDRARQQHVEDHRVLVQVGAAAIGAAVGEGHQIPVGRGGKRRGVQEFGGLAADMRNDRAVGGAEGGQIGGGGPVRVGHHAVAQRRREIAVGEIPFINRVVRAPGDKGPDIARDRAGRGQFVHAPAIRCLEQQIRQRHGSHAGVGEQGGRTAGSEIHRVARRVAAREPAQRRIQIHIRRLVDGFGPAGFGDRRRRGDRKGREHRAMVRGPGVDAVALVQLHGIGGSGPVTFRVVNEINPVEHAVGFFAGFGCPGNAGFVVGKAGGIGPVARMQLAVGIAQAGIGAGDRKRPAHGRVVQMRRRVEVAREKARFIPGDEGLHCHQHLVDLGQADLVFLVDDVSRTLAVLEVIRAVGKRREMAVEQMRALARAQLDRHPARVAGDVRREKGIPAHDGAVVGGQDLETQVRGDGLRGRGIAFLEADNVGAAGADDLDAIAQTQAALHPDVKAQDFELSDGGGAQGTAQGKEPLTCLNGFDKTVGMALRDFPCSTTIQTTGVRHRRYRCGPYLAACLDCLSACHTVSW